MNLCRRVWTLWLMACCTLTAHASTVHIMAASSLTEALTVTTAEHDVSLSFGSSGRISAQILAGAPADIVALAHPLWMEQLESAGKIERQVTLFGNRLVLATQAGNTMDLRSLSSLITAQKVGIASEASPAGQYAREALRVTGIFETLQPQLVTGSNVRTVLSHLVTGAVDAAFVYQSDLTAEPSLNMRFVVDPGLHTPIQVLFALTKTGAKKPEAIAVFAHLQGDESTGIFLSKGFSNPPTISVHPQTLTAAAPAFNLAPVGLSVWVGFMSLIGSIIPALALGWLMARRQFRGKALVSTLCLAPLVLPPVVTGWILLQLLTLLGIPVAFTRWAAVLAAAVVGFPLLLILTRQAIESVDIRYPQLAETLGLTPLQAFIRVTLPMALPGISAGCVLAFSRALGEFGATAMIAGDQPGETRTLALAVYALTEQPGGAEPAARLVFISIALTLGALLLYERLVWRQRRVTGRTS
jgi:molybdate transport system permease protein